MFQVASCTFNSVLLNNSTRETNASRNNRVRTDIIEGHQEEVYTNKYGGSRIC